MAWQYALIGAAVVFVGFVVLKLRLGVSIARRGELAAEVRGARARVYAAKGGDARSRALCEAAIVAARAGRWTSTAGFLLRAIRAAPTSARPVDLLISELTVRRPKLVEKVLWRRLAQLPWDRQHAEVLAKAADGLAAFYTTRRRDPVRAEVLARLAAQLNELGP